MRTKCRSGSSQHSLVGVAVREALELASSSLAGEPPALGLLFVSSRHDLGAALCAARELASGVDFVGCSTAGELTERGASQGGVSVMLVAWGDAAHGLRVVSGLAGEAARAAGVLCADFGQLRTKNLAASRTSSTTMVFGNGLCETLGKVVPELRKLTHPDQQIVGAGAGDEATIDRPCVGNQAEWFGDGAVAVHAFSRRNWGVGVAHGLGPAGPRMVVTRASGNIVHTLDGMPTLEVYRRRAESRGLTLTHANQQRFLLENQLGVLLFDDVLRVRAPIAVEADDSVRFAAELPEDSTVCFMGGTTEEIIGAARSAAEDAMRELETGKPAGLLVFSCVCRRMVLAERYSEELAAIRSVFPDTPIAGFVSYGEIARTRARLDGYHNDTVVVVAIPE